MIPDQRGRLILITGANTGIGRVTAERLAEAGAALILAGRSAERHRAVLHALQGGDVSFVPLDLGDLASVRAAARSISAGGRAIDVLINNAGIAGHHGRTEDGFELTFGVNHLGPFLLTRLLLPDLLRGPAPRVVNVSSRAHLRARSIPFEQLRAPTPAGTTLPEYQVSKLANVLFTKELVRRYAADGLISVSLHPGVVATDIWRSLPAPIEWLIKQVMITPERGAKTTLHCATDPGVGGHNGAYFARCAPARENPLASDEALARALWGWSSDACGLDPG